MDANFSATEPEKIEFTLRIRMTLKDWEELQGQLSAEWPASKLSRQITDMVYQAKKIFWPEEE